MLYYQYGDYAQIQGKAAPKVKTSRKKKRTPFPVFKSRPTPLKGDITIRLACGHTFKTDSRPNPRKSWPDPQTCSDCKRKSRVTEIHTVNPKVAE